MRCVDIFIIILVSFCDVYHEIQCFFQDEKDKRIRELTIELNNEKQKCKRKCAAYREKLRMVLAYIEEHTNHLSSKVENVVKNL